METAHLLRSRANAERLMRSLAQAEAGAATPHDLLDPDSPAERQPTGRENR